LNCHFRSTITAASFKRLDLGRNNLAFPNTPQPAMSFGRDRSFHRAVFRVRIFGAKMTDKELPWQENWISILVRQPWAIN
jgi:hypothetical protein